MPNASLLDKVMPRWTERVTTEFGGRDPLGLSRVSNLITDYLLTGIITTTDRARYYSFYCWALWHIAANEKPRRYQEFVDCFRRREAVMALATVANNPQTSPVGAQTVNPRLDAAGRTGKIDCDFKVLPSNALGGYGQYYSGSLYSLGLTYRTEEGIDRVAQGDAETLAGLFHSTIKGTPYIKRSLFSQGILSMDDLHKTKRLLSLDSLTEPFCSEERRKLIDIFFGSAGRELSELDTLRRYSLAQILFTVSQYEEHGLKTNTQHLDWHLIYSPCYYDKIGPVDDRCSSYTPPQVLAFCKSVWKQFCLQQFFSQAMESLLCSVLETLTTESAGLAVDDIVGNILQPEFFQILQEATGNPCLTPHGLLRALGVDGVPSQAESTEAQMRLSLLDQRSEATVLKSNRKTAEAMAARAVLLLSVLYSKWRGIRQNSGLAYVESHAGSELWAKPVLFRLDSWLDSEASWSEVLKPILEVCILDQHDRIMYEKRRLDSCWLHRSESRVLRDQDYSPRWRSSRHTNAVRILCDLGLLHECDEGNIFITGEGKSVLRLSLEGHE